MIFKVASISKPWLRACLSSPLNSSRQEQLPRVYIDLTQGHVSDNNGPHPYPPYT